MSFRRIIIPCLMAVLCAVSCMTGRKVAELENAGKGVNIHIVSDEEPPEDRIEEESARVDSSGANTGGPLIMNAIRDTETGEMVATDIIVASKVSARFRNVAERMGQVEIQFDITVPKDLMQSDLRLKFSPLMSLYRRQSTDISAGSVLAGSEYLEPVYITGNGYRQRQLRGYQRYEAFLSTIISDTTMFIRENQLEQFLRRYFPETYAMKTDTSFVYDTEAENLFGVGVKAAVEHYTNQLMKSRNEKRIMNKDRMFRRYVKDPLSADGIRIDTVFSSPDGDLTYRYIQAVKAMPLLRKIQVDMEGSVFKDGQALCSLPGIDSLVFYVSSLSAMADEEPRYIFKILERQVTDHTNAYIDFEQGRAVFDTLAEGNASELKRIRRSFSDVGSNGDLVLDSVIITASCSPEGGYEYNSKLARKRSAAVSDYVEKMLQRDGSELPEACLKPRSVAENWDYFDVLVRNDTILSEAAKAKIAEISAGPDKEAAERRLGTLPQYRYLREKIYPKLRTVRFDFHLHRKNMEKDTVHTTEIDTVYMKGVEFLITSAYKEAATLLKPYNDFNSALAMASSGYDDSALLILRKLDPADAKVSYLISIVLARMGRYKEAAASFERSVNANPAMRHRANLDPEMSVVLEYIESHNNNQ